MERWQWLQILLPVWLGIGNCLLGIHAINPMENEIDHQDTRSHPNPKLPASEMPQIHYFSAEGEESTIRSMGDNLLLPVQVEVDIFKLINVSYKDQGVSLVEGPISKYPSYKFRLPYGNVPLTNSNVLTDAMNNTKGFTVVFLYRQQKNNLGTLLSLNSPGRLTPWFQLTSNSKTGILTLKYRLRNSNKLNQIDWGLPRHHRKSPLAAWIWLSLSMDFQEDLVRLDLDCSPSSFETIPSRKGSHSRVGVPSDALVYFRQEPGRKKKFLGSMQVAKILPYVTHERLWNCLEISAKLSPEFRKPIL